MRTPAKTINLGRRIARLAILLPALFIVSACTYKEDYEDALFWWRANCAAGYTECPYEWGGSERGGAPYDQDTAGAQDTGTAADNGGGGGGNGNGD